MNILLERQAPAWHWERQAPAWRFWRGGACQAGAWRSGLGVPVGCAKLGLGVPVNL